MTKIVFQGVCNVYHYYFDCKWKPLLNWLRFKGKNLRKTVMQHSRKCFGLVCLASVVVELYVPFHGFKG